MLSAAISFGLNASQAKRLVDEMCEVVVGWREIAKANGIATGDTEKIAWAIAYADALR